MLRITVSTRIFAGFGVVVVLLIALALQFIVTLGDLRQRVDSYSHIAENLQRVLAIKANFAEVRRNVVAFAERFDQPAAERVRVLQTGLRRDLQAAVAAARNPTRKANLAKMQEVFEAYMAGFDRIVTLRTTREDLVTKQMNVIGAQARKDLTQIVHTAIADGDFEAAALAGIAEEALMLARLNAIKFLAEPSDDFTREAESNIDLFVREAEALTQRLHNPERKRLATESENNAREYRAAFAKVATATRQLDTQVYKDNAGLAQEFADLADQTNKSQDESMAEISHDTKNGMEFSRIATWVGSTLAFGLAVILSLLIARSIVGPVKAMTHAMVELSKGNKRIDIPARGRHDEIGAMAEAMGVFKDNTLRMEQMQAEQEQQKIKAEADRLAAMRKMADSFEGSVGKVIETVTSAATELQAASGQMAGTATETSAQATTVASAAQQASANVETVASATEELAASIREIAHQVEMSQTVSIRAGQEADTTTAQVKELSDKVGKIGEIVNLINDIAAQTNLLALNATIEAARAGDAGKGFAVVAGEVKNLANQTARATSEIAAQIAAVQSGTSAAVHAIDSIAKVIGEMGEISSAVAAAVQEQTAATGEIARNVEQASAGTQEVSANIVSVEQAARETGGAAEQIKISATDLSKQAEFLRHEVGQFLNQVRADKKDMVLMVWKDELTTGISTVDRYHRDLFEHVNDFYREMMSGEGEKAAGALLAELDKGMRGHFEEEEGLMAKHHYQDAASHHAGHKAFLDRIPALKRAIEEKRPNASAELFEYAATWLQNHISKDDKALALFLRQKRAA